MMKSRHVIEAYNLYAHKTSKNKGESNTQLRYSPLTYTTLNAYYLLRSRGIDLIHICKRFIQPINYHYNIIESMKENTYWLYMIRLGEERIEKKNQKELPKFAF